MSSLQARVYFRKELFKEYHFRRGRQRRPRFGVSLSVLIDCLSAFTFSSGNMGLELRYPGPDMQLLLKLMDSNRICTDAEIRTRIPETTPREYDFNLGGDGPQPLSFAIKSAALKEIIEDLEWPGSSIVLTVHPDPPRVTFRGEGHGDLQIELFYNAQSDLFISFQCDRRASFRYKYKHLKATTANIPASIVKDNRGSKLTVNDNGLLRVQHMISIRSSSSSTAGNQPQPQFFTSQGLGTTTGQGSPMPRVSYTEFFVMPEEEPLSAGGQMDGEAS
ncbi:hypothetical protein CBR_g3124 [Chara braunii]|uniref:Uncharacterized protein n=1 Tax=Chara braunii TaxID=69332 RepID=A0A388KEV1_CHABU|nr:hypothetical protein CBR_g3124 [Chara braunii]|eukprot:GBG68579.1 hypothetical protein CBR_g3124 [Chara braunii]